MDQLSKTAVCEITKELRARDRAFRARGLGEVELLVLCPQRWSLDNWCTCTPPARLGCRSH